MEWIALKCRCQIKQSSIPEDCQLGEWRKLYHSPHSVGKHFKYVFEQKLIILENSELKYCSSWLVGAARHPAKIYEEVQNFMKSLKTKLAKQFSDVSNKQQLSHIFYRKHWFVCQNVFNTIFQFFEIRKILTCVWN